DEQGGVKRIAAAAADPADAELARRLLRCHAPLPNAPHGVSRTAAVGRAELVTQADDAVFEAFARDAEHREMLRAMRLTSYICAPLVTRERTIGVITFGLGTSARRFT